MSQSLHAEMFLVDALLATSLQYAVLVTDRDGRVQWINEGFAQRYGCTLAEVRGLDEAALPGRSGAEGGNGSEGRFAVVRQDKEGRSRYLSLERRAILDAQGAVTGRIEIESDVSDLVAEHAERLCAHEAGLREALHAAEAASKAKSEFLAHVSHEIRTPMNAIVGMTDWALQTALSPEQREYLNLIRSSAQSLLSLINPILDLSKIEAGRLEVEQLPFSLRTCLTESVNTLALAAFQKGLDLSFEVDPDVPDDLCGDPLRLRQVVLNLISNAIKFTSRGAVILHVRRQGRSDSHITCHFTVKDSGIGIAREQQAKIFTPYTQADPSFARVYGGAGLGLSISAQLVKLMQGRIWVESKPGRGSIFHFTLPFGLVPAADASRTPPSSTMGLGRSLLGKALRKWSLTGNGSACATPAAHPSAPAPRPALACAVVGQESEREPSRRSRLRTPRFLRLVSATTDAAPAESAPLVAKSSDTELAAPTAAADVSCALDILLVEDEEVNRKLAQAAIERLGHRVTVVGDGALAMARMRQQHFDLLLMDVQLPVMDGLAAARAIRGQEALHGGHVPIIALTAHAREEDRQRCLAAGMDAYLTKPLQTDALGDTIVRLCLDQKKDAESLPVLDREALWERAGGDRKLLGDILTLFRRDSRRLLFQARHAVHIRNDHQLHYALHTLAGMLRNLSAESCRAVITELMTAEGGRDWARIETGLLRLEQEAKRLELALVALVLEPNG